MNSTCSVDGCVRNHHARGWCRAHYNRWRRTGTAGPSRFRSWRRGEVCAVDGCTQQHHSGGYCATHYARVASKGTTEAVGTGRFQPGSLSTHWRGDECSYEAAHSRVHKQRGRAADYACQHCGDTAAQWAYDHADPDSRTDRRGCRYSPDPSHYIPLCHSCHRRFDLAHPAL